LQQIIPNTYWASILGINIPELRFADDMSLLAESEHYLQLVDHLHAASNRFGLKVSNYKTEVAKISEKLASNWPLQN